MRAYVVVVFDEMGVAYSITRPRSCCSVSSSPPMNDVPSEPVTNQIVYPSFSVTHASLNRSCRTR